MKVIETERARRAELAQIHIAVADLRWSDDDYRAILHAKTGKSSAADLDSTGRKRFLEHLRACGWKPKARPLPLNPQQWRIRKLWQDLGKAGVLTDPSDKALLAFIQAHGSQAQALQFVAPRDAHTIIDALQGWLKRVSRK